LALNAESVNRSPFGFGDGASGYLTDIVADVLRKAGYTVSVEPWGIHNTVIDSIRKGGIELIPLQRIRFGYDEPRHYLPKKHIRLLDRELSTNREVAA
jgi:hypothetical protein